MHKPPSRILGLIGSFARNKDSNREITVGDFALFQNKLFGILESIRDILGRLVAMKERERQLELENQLEARKVEPEKTPKQKTNDNVEPDEEKKGGINIPLLLAGLGAGALALLGGADKTFAAENEALEKEAAATRKAIEMASKKFMPDEKNEAPVQVQGPEPVRPPTVKATPVPQSVAPANSTAVPDASPPVPQTMKPAQSVAPPSPPQKKSGNIFQSVGRAIGDIMKPKKHHYSKDIPPEGRALLDTIAKSEGGEYNYIVGLGTGADTLTASDMAKNRRQGHSSPPAIITNFSDHPRVVGFRTAEGPSTAAGRYQITETTWDDLRKRHKDLTDFSPEKQDLAAWYLAQERYPGNLQEDLRAGKIGQVLQALNKTWTSIQGGVHEVETGNIDNLSRSYQSAQTPQSSAWKVTSLTREVASRPRLVSINAPTNVVDNTDVSAMNKKTGPEINRALESTKGRASSYSKLLETQTV